MKNLITLALVILFSTNVMATETVSCNFVAEQYNDSIIVNEKFDTEADLAFYRCIDGDATQKELEVAKQLQEKNKDGYVHPLMRTPQGGSRRTDQ